MSQRSVSLFFAQHLAGRGAYQMGDYASAEVDEREALAARKIWGTEAIPDQRDLGEVSTWLAMALARESRLHFIAAGHYATETFGVRRLGEHLAERFGVRHVFLDVPNPV